MKAQRQHTSDPAFTGDGYHLTSGSAAINQGQPAGVPTDIDRQPHSFETPDLGADEYWLPGTLWIHYLPCVVR